MNSEVLIRFHQLGSSAELLGLHQGALWSTARSVHWASVLVLVLPLLLFARGGWRFLDV